ncbi:MAG: exodeoxyribonuclease VII large subunit, partial [Deltaproteobacteria bacterium]
MSPAEHTSPELPFETGLESGEPQRPLSVSQLIGLIADAFDREFADVAVAGEISKWTVAASGHCYFTLSDEDARIDAVMWRSDAARLRIEPQVGDEVVCRGKVGVYGPQGRMQLYVTTLRPVGWGAAQRALEELKRKLAAEGLFAEERKRPLPRFPATVGVVTSRAGAALHDILTTIARRSRGTRVLISPAQVQGEEAPASIVAALKLLAEDGSADVVIVGRGGGASEDLAAFNDERVVRAVAS